MNWLFISFFDAQKLVVSYQSSLSKLILKKLGLLRLPLWESISRTLYHLWPNLGRYKTLLRSLSPLTTCDHSVRPPDLVLLWHGVRYTHSITTLWLQCLSLQVVLVLARDTLHLLHIVLLMAWQSWHGLSKLLRIAKHWGIGLVLAQGKPLWLELGIESTYWVNNWLISCSHRISI